MGATIAGVAVATGDGWSHSRGLSWTDTAWVVLAAWGVYALIAVGLVYVLRLRTVATGAWASLTAAALVTSIVQVERKWHSQVHLDVVEWTGRFVVRMGASLLVPWLIYLALRRIPPVGARVRRVFGGLTAILIVVSGASVARELILPLQLSRVDQVTLAEPPPPGAARPDLVLLLIDTLRADRLGAYGNLPVMTPHLDRLSRHGTLFSHRLSHASWTKPETATILTSLHPTVHGAAEEHASLPETVVTLPEILSSRGYFTLGYSANGAVSPAFHMSQGFSEFHYLASTNPRAQRFYDLTPIRFLTYSLNLPLFVSPAYGATSDQMVEAVRARLRGEIGSGSLFLYVHFMDPHGPYFDPPGRTLARRVINYARIRDRALSTYEGEIAFNDHQIGVLLADLRSRAVLDDALVAVTSDHGEEFYEHGHISHGHSLFDELLRVPLILSSPSQSEGKVVSRTVRGIDVAPTLLARLGLPTPDVFEGHDALDPDAPSPSTMFHEEDFTGLHIRALRSGRYKLIVQTGRSGDSFRLYDLARDPAESENLARIETTRAAQLESELQRTDERLRSLAHRSVAAPARSQDLLRALGYVD